MKFGNIELGNWESFGPIFLKQGFKKNSGIINFAPICLDKLYSSTSSSYVWKVSFCNELQYLQKIYDDALGDKKFGRDEEKLAMNYVDQFLIRMNKLRVFI